MSPFNCNFEVTDGLIYAYHGLSEGG